MEIQKNNTTPVFFLCINFPFFIQWDKTPLKSPNELFMLFYFQAILIFPDQLLSDMAC